MDLVVSTIEMSYGDIRLEPGMTTVLAGFPGDQRLLDIGYLRMLEDDAELQTCGQCGAQFVGSVMVQRHERRKHGHT
jgi:hypothetical protein